MLAACTSRASSEPAVSVTMWRLRPFTLLAGSNPHGPPLSVVFALWLSITQADGMILRPASPRTHLTESKIDPPLDVSVEPVVEIVLHGRVRRKVFGQRTLCAPSCQDVENRVHHLAQIDLARTPNMACWWKKERQQQPLRIGHVACISKVITSILFAGDFSPSHLCPPSNRQIRWNHKGLESLNSFSVRHSGKLALGNLTPWSVDSIDLIDDEMRRLVAKRWPHLLSKIKPAA